MKIPKQVQDINTIISGVCESANYIDEIIGTSNLEEHHQEMIDACNKASEILGTIWVGRCDEVHGEVLIAFGTSEENIKDLLYKEYKDIADSRNKSEGGNRHGQKSKEEFFDYFGAWIQPMHLGKAYWSDFDESRHNPAQIPLGQNAPTITEQNIALAEWLGLENQTTDIRLWWNKDNLIEGWVEGSKDDDHLRFHCDWRWIQAVVEQCWEHSTNLDIDTATMLYDYGFIAVAEGDKDGSYKAIVEYVDNIGCQTPCVSAVIKC